MVSRNVHNGVDRGRRQIRKFFLSTFLLQGQVEVRGELGADGTYTGWKVRMLATKPGEISAWLAVDDFR